MIDTNTMWSCTVQPDLNTPEEYLQKGKLGRHIFWQNKERKGKKKTAVKVLSKAEDVLLAASLIGIPLLRKKNKITKLMHQLHAFKEAKKIAPPKDIIISVKTDQQTFNHLHEYVIYEGFIWYREKDQIEQEWQAMYFDGFPNKHPIKIQADGANLIVLDQKNYIHYKRVINEKLDVFEKNASKAHSPKLARKKILYDSFEFVIKDHFIWIRDHANKGRWQALHFDGWPHEEPVSLSIADDFLVILTNKNRYELSLSGENIEKILEGQNFPYSYHYHCSEVESNLNPEWTEKWFTAPIIHHFNFAKKKLKIPEGVIDLAISCRGGRTSYWKDAADVQHPCYIRVDTFYILTESGKIYYADPWLPHEFSEESYPLVKDKNIELPENFMAQKLCASASVLCVLGEDIEKGVPKMMYRLEDFDTCGINPALPYTSLGRIQRIKNKNLINPEIRILKDDYNQLPTSELWINITLEGLENSSLNSETLTIFQTGQGNLAKTLRIETHDQMGYYEKFLSDDSPWTFYNYE